MKPTKKLLIIVFCLAMALQASAQRWGRYNTMRRTDKEFFKSEEARRIGQQILAYQRITGGWPKNIDMAKQMDAAEMERVVSEKHRRDDSNIDNGATTMQMAFLARLYQGTGDVKYKDAFNKALDYLRSGQYDNGGWPQFWPETHGYQYHITYNDNAIINILNLFSKINKGEEPYNGDLTDKKTRKALDIAIKKAIECILATQIVTDGQLTVWCQQHDRNTFLPAPARSYELPSYCSQESAAIIQFLMEQPKPDARIKKAIHAAMRWFDKYKLKGYRVVRTGRWGTAEHDTKLIKDSMAPALWARYYDLERCEPYVCDRDGIPRRHLHQIGHERRTGYGWYSERPGELFAIYEAWADKHDPKNKVCVSLETMGANENGTVDWFRKPEVKIADFDAVVNAGQSIQTAIESAPATPEKPYKILIRKGTYNQKVIIDRPNIVLVGEDRDSTIIVLAELAKKLTIKEYNGKPVGNGVIVIQEGADDCIISGLTVYNNYGSTVEQTTAHQMAIFGRGTRTIVINSNILADGNDALSLWAKEGNGMYYHADLSIRCPGVDFLCPRGWCYATRCSFYGDGRALIWHDGRGDKSKKLVITESVFDAKRPTILGRYHHDSQFFLINCKMTEQILDTNISYAYTDKVLDPCPWGLRTYYYNCYREGGNSGWLSNNLHEAENAPEYHGITALWTFEGKWNPEKRIRELWNVLAY
ncbi:MAG: pectate lyase [Prevotella sp.]|nr:pectate lyase [Prevotella sp.]